MDPAITGLMAMRVLVATTSHVPTCENQPVDHFIKILYQQVDMLPAKI